MEGSILFFDICSYSKKRDEAQRGCVIALAGIVNKCLSDLDLFDKNKITMIPAGDAMLIALFDKDRLMNLRFALKLSERIHSHNELTRDEDQRFNVHMGLSHGHLYHYLDINGQVNLAGLSINEAERMCSAAGPRQIVASETLLRCGPMGYDPLINRFTNRFSLTIKSMPFICNQYIDVDNQYLDSTNIIGDGITPVFAIPALPKADELLRVTMQSRARRCRSNEYGGFGWPWPVVRLESLLNEEQLKTMRDEHPEHYQYLWRYAKDHYWLTFEDLYLSDEMTGIVVGQNYIKRGSLISKGPIVVIDDEPTPVENDVISAAWISNYSSSNAKIYVLR